VAPVITGARPRQPHSSRFEKLQRVLAFDACAVEAFRALVDGIRAHQMLCATGPRQQQTAADADTHIWPYCCHAIIAVMHDSNKAIYVHLAR
jgi:hypothetical protein